MKTPAGKECPYFYGNYYRGRKQEECRLINSSQSSPPWNPDLCKTCPVPEITLANVCENMVLSAKVDNGILGLHKRIKISAYCKKTSRVVKEPRVGCGECHSILGVITEKQ